MIFGLELTLFLFVALAAAYRLIRQASPTWANGLLAACSALLLISANMALAIYLFLQVVLVVILYTWIKRRHLTQPGFRPWLAFLGLLPMNYEVWFGKKASLVQVFGPLEHAHMPNVLWSVGASFFVIKSFIILKESLAEKRLRVGPALVALLFLPSFTAGPIHGTKPWRDESLASDVTPGSLLQGMMKIGWGAAALYVLAPLLREWARQSGAWTLGFVPDMYLSFAALYFDFSGYSLLAIGTASFFGATLPENFNRPYLATNIQQFWQRWHMSLSAFIGTYLFKPFVRKTGSPRKGIFLAFLCTGLWHELSLGYLLWGVGHGAALSTCMKPPAWYVRLANALPAALKTGINWLLTMTWVSALSMLATRLPW